MKKILPLMVALALVAASQAHAAASAMVTAPDFPTIADDLKLKLGGNGWPVYIPTVSYQRQGNAFTFDYDGGTGFDANRGDMGNPPIAVGALPPGTYTAYARVRDLANPSAPPQMSTAYFTVSTPYQADAFAVPAQPQAYDPWTAVVSSAYFLYPGSLRTTVSGNVVRVTFDYEPGAPTSSGTGPSGTAAHASIAIAGIPPGAYTLQFDGTPRGGGATTLQYRKAITVQGHSQVAEYYNESTGHYFISGGPGEMAGLDAPVSGWRRTGESFNAWLSPGDAPAGAVPVCRFYSPGSNSHFYTASATECGDLKATDDRARAGGKAYSGWNFEGIAFQALVPVGGACPSGTVPVYRWYDNRWRQNDSNHRFPTSDEANRAMYFTSWTNEGIAFCSP